MKIRNQILAGIILAFGGISVNCSTSSTVIRSDDSRVQNATFVHAPLKETRWDLVQLMGKPLPDTIGRKEIFITFRTDESRMEGNGGCNAFSGTYELKNNRISIGPVVSTKMFCPSLQLENEFFRALSAANHYYIKSDSLYLTEGKVLVLAKFIANKNVSPGKSNKI